MIKDKKTGAWTEEETDAGVDDKRLMVLEAGIRLAAAAHRAHRQRPVADLGRFWDSGKVVIADQELAGQTTGAMVSVIGHITVDELRRYLTRTEMGNGLANRFLFACVAVPSIAVRWRRGRPEPRRQTASGLALAPRRRRHAAWWARAPSRSGATLITICRKASPA